MSDSELESRLRELELTVKELSALVRSDLAQLNTLVKSHSKFLFGTLEAPGLTIRVDRLERRDATRRWGVRLALASGATALACYAASFF